MTLGGRLPQLVINIPSGLKGTALPIPPGRRVVGRAPASDLQIADEHVSRTHAALHSTGGRTLLEDLGSSGGTLVNGVPLQGRRPLRHGDLIRFGPVEARYEEPDRDIDQTTVRAGSAVSRYREPPSMGGGIARYDIGHQQAGQLSNVGGNQYNQYVQQVQAERASFLRDVAAAKTRASRVVVVGFVLFLVGTGIYFWVAGRTAGNINDALSDFPSGPGQDFPEQPPVDNFLGPNIGGFPLAFIGIALTTVGSLLVIVGLILHIVTASRRKHYVERTRDAWPAPPPPTW